jgi:hypothetical protein
MGKETRHRAGVALGVALAIGGGVLWMLASASPGEASWEPEAEEFTESPARRVHGAAGALQAKDERPRASRAVASFPVAPRVAASNVSSLFLPASAPPAEEHAASAPEERVTRLPPSTLELGPDGLPVSGMRCTREGDGFSCGSCRTSSDCPPGRGCVANRETRRFECMDSECEEDMHCFPGFVCRRADTVSSDLVIRRCVPEGRRREGEPCDAGHLSAFGSCREGLRCIRQVCAAPCALERPGSCPEGHLCTDSPDGPGCVPDCRRLGCPEEQECTRMRGESYQCLVSSRGDCNERPCAEGERCNVRQSRGRAGFWCAAICDPLVPDSCPAGQVCGMGGANVSTCFQRCDPLDAWACGEGQVCGTISADMRLFGCQPDLER